MFIDGKEIKYLYIATSHDKYELPLCVADSIKELATMVKLPATTLSIYYCLGRPYYYKIDVSEE